MKKRVFISYRRDDTRGSSQSINKILRDSFDIFFDKDDAISYEREFPKALRKGVQCASMVLSTTWRDEETKRPAREALACGSR